MFIINKEATLFQSHPEITVGITDSSMNFRSSVMLPSIQKLSEYEGVPQENIKVLTQIHSNKVVGVDSSDMNTQDAEADALVTNLSGIIIGVKTADCVPVLLFDPVTQAIGAIHAGRKGAKDGVIESTLDVMVEKYKVDPKNLIAYLGPALGSDNHAIFKKDAAEFESVITRQLPPGNHNFSTQEKLREFLNRTGLTRQDLEKEQTVYIDLPRFVIQKLKDGGVSPKNILDSSIDSFTNTNTHSYRRDFPNHGLTLSYIGVKTQK